MADNYEKIINANLQKLYDGGGTGLENRLPARRDGQTFVFRAFGQNCMVSPGGIYLDEKKQTGPLGIVISLYALNCGPGPCILTPFKAFKQFPGSAPYVGAFASHTEQILVPFVDKIRPNLKVVRERFSGRRPPEDIPGDFSMVLYPFPKIALCYIFYEADEDFPPGVTCLFSNNADEFIPLDGLADTGEYCSKTIVGVLE